MLRSGSAGCITANSKSNMNNNWTREDVDEYNSQLKKICDAYPGLSQDTCEKFAAEIVERKKAKKKD